MSERTECEACGQPTDEWEQRLSVLDREIAARREDAEREHLRICERAQKERDEHTRFYDLSTTAESSREMHRDFDKAVVTLSAGAILLSATFLEKIASDPIQLIWLLRSSWVLFAVALIAMLLAAIVGHYSLRNQIDSLAGRGERSKALKFGTMAANYTALGAFAIATALFIGFAWVNVKGIRMTDKKTPENIIQDAVKDAMRSPEVKRVIEDAIKKGLSDNPTIGEHPRPSAPAGRPLQEGLGDNPTIGGGGKKEAGEGS